MICDEFWRTFWNFYGLIYIYIYVIYQNNKKKSQMKKRKEKWILFQKIDIKIFINILKKILIVKQNKLKLCCPMGCDGFWRTFWNFCDLKNDHSIKAQTMHRSICL